MEKCGWNRGVTSNILGNAIGTHPFMGRGKFDSTKKWGGKTCTPCGGNKVITLKNPRNIQIEGNLNNCGTEGKKKNMDFPTANL